jgi:peptidoglycan/LPS O-acetylase OafA/YrhL
MILGLETLRGLAALAVAFYHFPSDSLLFIQNGYMAVYLFFSLSGFVITLNYFKKIDNVKSLILFQKKRFFRLYPVHFFVLILVLLIQCLKFVLIELGLPAGGPAFGGNEDQLVEGVSWYSLKDFIFHIFLLQAVLDYGYFLSWNAAAWTISVEFYTYFVFGLLVLFSFRKFYIFIIFIILYKFYSANVFDFIDIHLNIKLHAVFQSCLTFFFTGSLMFFIYDKIKYRINDFIFFSFLSIFFYLFFEKTYTN